MPISMGIDFKTNRMPSQRTGYKTSCAITKKEIAYHIAFVGRDLYEFPNQFVGELEGAFHLGPQVILLDIHYILDILIEIAQTTFITLPDREAMIELMLCFGVLLEEEDVKVGRAELAWIEASETVAPNQMIDFVKANCGDGIENMPQIAPTHDKIEAPVGFQDSLCLL